MDLRGVKKKKQRKNNNDFLGADKNCKSCKDMDEIRHAYIVQMIAQKTVLYNKKDYISKRIITHLSTNMPFLYKVEFGHSKERGKGLYASEDIPAGATYWTLMPHPQQVPMKDDSEPIQNKVYTEEQFNALTEDKKKAVVEFGYFFSNGNVLIALLDGSYYFNHDANGPSLTVYEGDLQQMYSKVTRDVKKGEEITEDYSHWSVKQSPWLERVMKDYLPERHDFEMIITARSNDQHQENPPINKA